MKTIIIAAFLLLTSCVTYIPQYSQTASKTYTSKLESCDFEFQTTLPDPSKYAEIGVLNGCSTYIVKDYKDRVRKQVCEAGGDLIVGQVNGQGVYCLATVFKKK